MANKFDLILFDLIWFELWAVFLSVHLPENAEFCSCNGDLVDGEGGLLE